MNKKFSTLMAGLMLASAFSVNAQIAKTTGESSYQNGKYYLLGNGTNFLSVSSNLYVIQYYYPLLPESDHLSP